MSDSVWPHRRKPTRLPRPWDSPVARTLEWVAISFFNAWKWKVKVKSLSRVQPSAWTAAYQAPPSMGFSRQVSWFGVTILKKKKKNSGIPFLPIGIFSPQLLGSWKLSFMTFPFNIFSFLFLYLLSQITVWYNII